MTPADDAFRRGLDRLGRAHASVFSSEFRSLIQLAIAAACTHLDAFGIERSIDDAVAHGATPERIRSVARTTATLGIHAATVGAPILIDVLHSRGLPAEAPRENQQSARSEFEHLRGGWHPIWDAVVRVDPTLLTDYASLCECVWEADGPLERWEQELICVAFDVATNHLYIPGVRLHIDGAFEAGASADMVREVIAIAAASGRSTIDYVEHALRKRSANVRDN